MNEKAKEYQIQGASMMGKGNFEKAKEYFKKALNEDTCASLYMDLGNAEASLGNYSGGIEAFNKVLLLEPNNAEAIFSLGSIYLLDGKLKKALEMYNSAEEKGFHQTILYTNLASIYQILGDGQMMIRNYTKAIDSNPLRGDLYVEKINTFIKMRRYQDALNTLEDLKKVLPDAFEAYDLAAKIYQGLGNSKKAEEILDEGLKKFPEDMYLRLSKIQLLVLLKETEKATDVINEMKSMPRAEEFKRAIQLQEVAVASVENNTDVMETLLSDVVADEKEGTCDEHSRYMLMMTCIMKENYDKALAMANVLENQKSKSLFQVSGLYYKGDILKKLGKTEEAILQFKKAVKELRDISLSQKAFYECYLYRALCHKELGEYEKAIELAEYIEQLHEERADGNILLAGIYKDMGQEEKSKQQFKIAKQKNPQLQIKE